MKPNTRKPLKDLSHFDGGGGGGGGGVYIHRILCYFGLRISLLSVPRRLFCFGSLVILDVACCYLWLYSLYINIKLGKNSC